MATFFAKGRSVGHPSNPYSTPVEYRARLMDTGNGFNFNRTESQQSRVMLALTGTLGNYDWKSAACIMDSTATKATRAVSAKGYTDAIVNTTFALDYYNIKRKDEIGSRSTSDILKGEAALPAGQLIRTDNTANDNEFLVIRRPAPVPGR